MILCMFSPKGAALERGWPGRIDDDTVVQLAAQTLQAFFTGGGGAREHAFYPLGEVDLRAPVQAPPGIRLFDGDGIDFVFGNTASVRAPGEEVAYPEGSSDLRFAPAIAAVVGAAEEIAGFTGAIAWRAADLPGAKARDFALTLGPVLVTADEYGVAAPWPERLAHARRNTDLRPGELLVAAAGEERPAPVGPLEVDLPAIGSLRAAAAPA